MKMQSWCIVFVAILFSSNLFAQKIFNNQWLDYDTSIFFDFSEQNIGQVCFDNDSTLIYNDSDKDTILTFFNIYNKKSFEISIGKYIEWVSEIFADKNYLIISTNDNSDDCILDVYIFERQNDNLKFLNTIHLDRVYSSTEAYFLNNGRMVMVDGYFGNCKEKNNNFLNLILLDIKEGKEIKRVTPNMELSLMTYFNPSKLVTLTDNSILFSQKGTYKIYEYDFNLNLVDSLSNKKLKWKTFPKSKNDEILAKYDNTSSVLVQRIGDMVNNNVFDYSRVEQMYYFNDKLFISYRNPYNKKSETKLSYDIWSKNNNQWVLEKSNIIDDVDKKLRKKKASNRMKYIFNKFLFVKDNKLFVLQEGMPYSLNYLFSLTDKEYEKKEKEYYLQNSDKMLLDVFNISLNNK